MSLYDFVDTTGSAGSASLPAEAMKWNGVYFENVIPGYRTLYVRGRESIDTEITDVEVGRVSGARYRRKRDSVRVLRVGYQIISASDTAFRNAFNLLNQYLDAEEAKIIFADESDKFFTGTKVSCGSPRPGTNAITAEIEIQCSDPYKYSEAETEVTATSGVASFNYDGTHPAYPVLEITCASNLGFAGAADDTGNVIQIGDPLEEGADGTDSFDGDKSVTDVTSTPPTTSNGWTLNGLGAVDHASSNAFNQTGTVNTGTIEGSTAVKTNSWGSGSAWHGPSIVYNIATPAKNATLSWKQLMYASSTSQLGNFHAELETASGQSIASASLYRNSKGSKTAKIDLYIAGKHKKSVSFTMDKTNTYTGTKSGVNSIDKFGDTITFHLGTKVYTLTDASIEDLTVGRAGFWFGRWASSTVLAANCVYSATVISHSGSENIKTYTDVPNKFQPGDVITVDCGEGTVYLNGVPKEGIGALGNDYETFTLKPGVNNIAFSCSDWATTAPTYKVKYRKAYI